MESEDEVICDLAQFYHVLNYKELSPDVVAALLVGLPKESRIVRKFFPGTYSLQEELLMRILDALNVLTWMNTKSGSKGINKPPSIYKLYHPKQKKKNKDAPKQFAEPEDFDKQWNKLTRKKV